jgi:hypothetical protein
MLRLFHGTSLSGLKDIPFVARLCGKQALQDAQSAAARTSPEKVFAGPEPIVAAQKPAKRERMSQTTALDLRLVTKET